MKVGFVIFDRMTALDFIGVYDPLTRLKAVRAVPDLEWDLCAATDRVTDDRGLRFTPTAVGRPLGGYDVIVVPGGVGTRSLIADGAFLSWLKTASPCPLKVSVCTGALLLGAAGFLAGKRATTHPAAFLELRRFCASVSEERLVDEGDIITGGGVTAALDVGLYLVERIAGPDVRARIARQIDYAPGART